MSHPLLDNLQERFVVAQQKGIFAKGENALLLCDNEAVLRVIKKWVGRGGKATLATAPDADILREIVACSRNACEQGELIFR